MARSYGTGFVGTFIILFLFVDMSARIGRMGHKRTNDCIIFWQVYEWKNVFSLFDCFLWEWCNFRVNWLCLDT